jgi:multiple sugar transport system permease protein
VAEDGAVALAGTAPKQTTAQTSSMSLAARRRVEGWLLVLPALLLIVALSIFPLLSSLALSFQRWDLQSQEYPFVGLQNYRDALTDPRVWGALQNTGLIVVAAVGLEFLLGLGLALLFVGDFKGKRLAMPLLMLPVMVVPVVVGLTWRMLWDNQYGAINQVLGWVTGREVNILWLAHRDTALFAMILTDIWQWTPFMFLVLLAGLSSVNPELHEAASLDGAGWWEQLRDVSLPGIARIVAVAILFRALDAFKIFDLIFMFTQGGPGTSTESVSWYIYQLGFKFFRLGYASAVSYVVVIFLSIVATLYVARFLREPRP